MKKSRIILFSLILIVVLYLMIGLTTGFVDSEPMDTATVVELTYDDMELLMVEEVGKNTLFRFALPETDADVVTIKSRYIKEMFKEDGLYRSGELYGEEAYLFIYKPNTELIDGERMVADIVAKVELDNFKELTGYWELDDLSITLTDEPINDPDPPEVE